MEMSIKIINVNISKCVDSYAASSNLDSFLQKFAHVLDWLKKIGM